MGEPKETRARGGWIPGLNDEARDQGLRRIEDGAQPGSTYFLLTVLSTLIASYGLLANSTATVIGAMIVAPLMGPIMGVAMGIVRADYRLFRRSLWAEVSGVGLVIFIGFLVAQLAGVSQIDFSASEIANRTRPTLYDLAIGLSAGLAGAFCLIHPSLQSGIAGVAIAVALVPPLAVTGITAAGWLFGPLTWRPALGSFMLFLANYLTIELAAALLFALAGYRANRNPRGSAAFRRVIVVNLLLLSGTIAFLSQQLHLLIRERVTLAKARQEIKKALLEIPGATLDGLEIIQEDQRVRIQATIGSRQDITPNTVARLQSRLRETLASTLQGNQPDLTVRTVNSVFANAQGYLFEPEGNPMSPEQQRLQEIESALRKVLERYPMVELAGYQPVVGEGPAAWNLELTVRSPFEFTPPLVGELEDSLNALIPPPALQLMVRTILVRTATGRERINAVPLEPEERSYPEFRRLLSETFERSGTYEVTQLWIRSDGSGSNPILDSYRVDLEIRGTRFLHSEQLATLAAEAEKAASRSQGRPVLFDLRVTTVLGQVQTRPAAGPP